MIPLVAKDAFWAAVEDCLVELHALPRLRARALSDDLRRQIEMPPVGMSSDIFYHAEPFDVACDIAGQSLDLTNVRSQYDAILTTHNW